MVENLWVPVGRILSTWKEPAEKDTHRTSIPWVHNHKGSSSGRTTVLFGQKEFIVPSPPNENSFYFFLFIYSLGNFFIKPNIYPICDLYHVRNLYLQPHSIVLTLPSFQSWFLRTLGQKEDCKCFWFHWKFWINKYMKMVSFNTGCLSALSVCDSDEGRVRGDSLWHLPSCIFSQRTLCQGSKFW